MELHIGNHIIILFLKNYFYFYFRDEEYYSVNPEFALLKIEHSFTAFTGSMTHSHRKMFGSLVDVEGKTIKRSK